MSDVTTSSFLPIFGAPKTVGVCSQFPHMWDPNMAEVMYLVLFMFIFRQIPRR